MSTSDTLFLLRKGWRIFSVYLFAGAFAAIFVCVPFADFRESGASQIAIILFFALINLLSMRAGVARMRRCAEEAEAEAKAAMTDDARAFG